MLRIADGREGKEDTDMVMSRTFELTAEEAQVAPNIIIGMYLSHFSCFN